MSSFPNALLITANFPTLVAVSDSTFLLLGVLVLRLHKYLLYCSVTLEVSLDTIFHTCLLEALTQALYVGDDHLTLAGFSFGRGLLLYFHLDCVYLVCCLAGYCCGCCCPPSCC